MYCWEQHWTLDQISPNLHRISTSINRSSRGKNKVDGEQPSTSGLTYTELYHNDNNFTLMFLPKEAVFCKACETDFCHRSPMPPYDLVFWHKERWDGITHLMEVGKTTEQQDKTRKYEIFTSESHASSTDFHSIIVDNVITSNIISRQNMVKTQQR